MANKKQLLLKNGIHRSLCIIVLSFFASSPVLCSLEPLEVDGTLEIIWLSLIKAQIHLLLRICPSITNLIVSSLRRTTDTTGAHKSLRSQWWVVVDYLFVQVVHGGSFVHYVELFADCLEIVKKVLDFAVTYLYLFLCSFLVTLFLQLLCDRRDI